MTGYVRNDSSNNIATGNVINASDIDGEFDSIVNAFNASTGHTHDGTSAEGAAITKVGPSQALEVTSSALVPKTDNTLDLGTSSFEFKDLYIDGTANIDSLVADTADINGGTIDGVTITTPRITTGLLDTNGNEIVLFTATGSAVNEITVVNAAASNAPRIAATGTDTNISLNIQSKGTGTVQINGAAALFSGGALGTPSSGTLTNATGLPISTGVSGLGSNVATALAVNVGSSGAVVVNGGALGTPSSGTLTNATGLPLSTGVTGQLALANGGTGANLTDPNDDRILFWDDSANAVTWLAPGTGISISGTTISATGSGGTVTSVGMTVPTGLTVTGSPVTTSGTLAVSLTSGYSIPTTASQTDWDTAYSQRLQWDGGSTSLNASTGRTSLGLGSLATLSTVTLTSDVTGTLPVANGGTGQTSFTNGQLLIGNSTGGTLAKATLTASTGISITNGAGSITIAATNNGTVTSVAVSGGTTGLTTSGGPITGSGTITLSGTLAVANGGTGVTTSTGSGSNVLSTSPTITTPLLTGNKETRVALGSGSGTRTVDVNAGTYFTNTVTGVSTFAVSNTPSSGTTAAFILDLTNGGSSTVNWMTNTKWAGGTPPTLTASGRDVLGFFTHDNGTTWNGFVLGLDVK